jgi:hypothetical protein
VGIERILKTRDKVDETPVVVLEDAVVEAWVVGAWVDGTRAPV